jgi:hypothetical protein
MNPKILNALKQNFSPYAPFWDEWKKYRYNGLSDLDIYALDIHIKNDFLAEITDLVMFYNQRQLLASLTKKLNRGYVRYQDWLIREFRYSVIQFADGVPLDLYFTTPIELFYTVPSQHRLISDDLITTLLKFKCTTLYELFTSHLDAGFRREESFKIIVEFQTLITIQKTIHKFLRKEVTSINRTCTLN